MTHCWAGYQEEIERLYGYGTEAYWKAHLRYPDNATCLLPDGHTGPHEWTDDGEVMISFAPTESDP
jgi:hypothetical protein